MELLPGLREAFPERAKRGRPPSSLSANFFRLKEKCNKTMWWTVCKYCYAEYVNDKENVPFPIAVHGRKEAWEKHLEACERYARVMRVRRIADNCGSVCENGDASKKHCIPPPGFTSAEIKTFWRLLLEYQAEALLPASFVELRSFKRLLTFLNPRCAATGAVPRRQVLGGQVLNEYSDLHSIEQRDDVIAMQQRTGGRINMLSDVRENAAKKHVLGCQVALFGHVMTYGLRPTGDRHDGLAIAQQIEEVVVELRDGGWKVGVIVTDNAGQCSRARRILALRHPDIALVFCFAHDVNNLVKTVLKNVFKEVSEHAAGVASFFNTSTSKWLVQAGEAMVSRYGDSFAIFSLCETRWNSMQACFASLLRVRAALEDFAFKYRNNTAFPTKLRHLGKTQFWLGLENAEKVVRPLWVASFRLQREENTVADVVVSYLDIYRGFNAIEWCDALGDCVESRWNACEQPLFVLGYYLHPIHIAKAHQLPTTVLTGLSICAVLLSALCSQ